MAWEDVFDDAGVRIASRELLIAHGATGRVLTEAVRSGALTRARRDHYALPIERRDIVAAVRVGGRVDCVSALADMNIFAFDTTLTHVRLEHEMSRMRSTRSRFIPLTEQNRQGLCLHWWPLDADEASTNYSVSVLDALVSCLRCQPDWLALASVENALHVGAVGPAAIDRVFASAFDRVQYLRSQVDGRAESGQETVLRMIATNAGLSCELQVVFPEVGRVDLVVEGCLALEADSRLAHDGWELHVRDRRRDLLLAQLGFMSLRPTYQHTMFEPNLVRASILGLLDQSRRFRRSFS